MRILLTADPELPVPPGGYGGIERIVDGLIGQFRAAGHEVGLVARRGSTAAVDRFFPWPGLHSGSSISTLRNMFALRRAVGIFHPAIVHSFSRLAYLLPLLVRGNIDLMMSYQRPLGSRQVRIADRLGRGRIRFTGCSEYICRLGRAAGGRWSAIPNFVDLDRYTFVERIAPDAPLVFLSRVETIKGPDLAIAIAKASGRRLILAGNHAERGPEREFWDTKIAPHLGQDGIEWVGEVNDAQKNELLGRAAALLVPIQWDEPFGIVFAEALACGTPVLTCRRGATPEIVDDGQTGLFLQTVADGVAAVRRLGDLNRTACRQSAQTRFSAATCAAQYQSLYQAMVASR
jgi:glycosyltransferase involved in cell wall biosynthesis